MVKVLVKTLIAASPVRISFFKVKKLLLVDVNVVKK